MSYFAEQNMDFNFSKKKIKQEQNLGQCLKKARKRKKFGLDQVEKETKISMKYLLALENGDFNVLPSNVYVIGFIGRYTNFLGLNSKKMIDKYHNELKIYKNYGIFEIEQKNKQKYVLNPQRGKKWLRTPNFIITPKLVISAMVMLLVVGILSYIWYQVRSFAAAPPLEIYQPAVEEIIKEEKVTTSGKTDPDAILTINNEFVAIDAEGRFDQEIKLEPGVNNIEIVSKNKTDKPTRRVLKVLAEYDK